jgi:hypothetical protein
VPGEMTMDIILEEVPDTANIQQEQFEMLVKLAQAGVNFPPKVYISASALRNKRELIEMLEEKKDPAQEAAEQLTMEKAKAEIEKMLSEIEKNKAQSVKTLAEADMLDAQLGQVINPQIIDLGAGMHQMPDGSIMQGNEHGQLQPVAPALDPNQEAQRGFEGQQSDIDRQTQAAEAEAQRQAQAQAQGTNLQADAQKQQVEIGARTQSQQAELAARQQAQQADHAVQREQFQQKPLNEILPQ